MIEWLEDEGEFERVMRERVGVEGKGPLRVSLLSLFFFCTKEPVN